LDQSGFFMSNASDNAVEVRRAQSGRTVILFDARSLPQAGPDQLDPEGWPQSQALRGRGGRGTAVLVRGEFGEGVLRHYRRGGLVGRFITDRYLFLGESRVRCVREFRLLVELQRRDLPVPRPLLAGWRRFGPFYRADLLTLRIPDSETLAERMARGGMGECLWRSVGTTIARFHRQGVYHADLNAHNVLLDADDAIWLIDFDRGALRVPSLEWQRGNLRRLRRSLDKLGGVEEGAWETLLSGYEAAMVGAGPEDIP